jgi:four helix bundle protein
MTEPSFDHDRLDVYRLSIEYVAAAFDVSKALNGLHRHARDQWLRAAQSIPLNIAEGNGKRSPKDRARFLDIARGSSFECAAIQDVLVASGGMNRRAEANVETYRVDVDPHGDEV